MLNQRTYIVNSPELVIAVQRNTKTLSFQPFVAAMLPKLFLIDETAMNIVKRNMEADEGNWGLIPDTQRYVAGSSTRTSTRSYGPEDAFNPLTVPG